MIPLLPAQPAEQPGALQRVSASARQRVEVLGRAWYNHREECAAMMREATAIDVSTMPDVARLAREVARSGKPRVLRHDGADLAILYPARPGRRRVTRAPSAADLAAFRALAGSWNGLIDSEALIAGIYESRQSSRPPVKL